LSYSSKVLHDLIPHYSVKWGVKESNLSSAHPQYFWTTGLQPASGNTPLVRR